MARGEFRVWRENKRIRRFQPKRDRARVVIAALGPSGLKTRGKVSPRRFFPPFCNVLGQCGVSTVYVHDRAGFWREFNRPASSPIILIDLVNETYDDLGAHDIREEFSQYATAVFNSHHTAEIIRDKKKANIFLSENGILMPGLDNLKDKKIFSNARVGSNEEVYICEDESEIDQDRYNSEFICTKQRYGGDCYYTSVRLMCIGPHLLQIYVRARDVNENNPSVHTKDTPQDGELAKHLFSRLVNPHLDEYSSLAKMMGSVLGPGFYAHDVLIDSNSEELYVCETGFKFFDDTYSSRMEGIVKDRKFRIGLLNQKTYAGYAASVFLTYCVEMGFL